AAQDHRGGVLALGAGPLLREIVVRGFLSQAKALVAPLHRRDDVVRRQLVALRLGQRGRDGEGDSRSHAQEGGGRCEAGDREKVTAAHATVSVYGWSVPVPRSVPPLENERSPGESTRGPCRRARASGGGGGILHLGRAMREGRASRTAEQNALFRALQTSQPTRRRLFEDPFARTFLGWPLGRVARLGAIPPFRALLPRLIDRRWAGVRSSVVARTRLIDDTIEAALDEHPEQLVILGAGFDSRAYRVSGLQPTRRIRGRP